MNSFFSQNTRTDILETLGLSVEQINDKIKTSKMANASDGEKTDKQVGKELAGLQLGDDNNSTTQGGEGKRTPDSEALIKEALLVGQTEIAVDCM